ncbi:MAG: efflux RND transporter periplasmic adaptor subunit [Saprospiraceae bacterium]|nr:efflux RND transporter periplasmic adaptor subunit [Saprospiraceae bacterium]
MAKGKTQKKRSRLFLWILLALLAVLVAAAIIRQRSQPKGEEVEMEKAERRTITEKVAASGKVFPEKEVKISSDVSGEIVELMVEEGDSVKTGQLLAKIDPDAYISGVERGEASVNNAKAQLAGSMSQQENARAQVEQMKAQLENARRIHERNIKLKEEGVISEADYESTQSSLEVAQANYNAAEASLKAAEQNSEAARYSMKSAEASLKELRTSLQRTSIFAPVDGVVSMLNVEQGERVVGTIQMAGTEMMRIANLNNMEVQVEVTENDILKVAMGDKAEIEVDAYLDRTFSGTVTEIANSAANAATTTSLTSEQVTNFVVKIRIDPASYQDILSKGVDYAFRPGMSASVDILTNTVEDALSIPIQAVTTRDITKPREGKEEVQKPEVVVESDENAKKDDVELDEVVFVVKGDTVALAKVETGVQDDEYIYIKSGLEDGDMVVTGPYRTVSKKLASGMEVRKKEDKPEDKK